MNYYGAQCAAGTSALFFSGLVANVLLYISWVPSPSQEADFGKGDEAKTAAAGALGNWKLVGMPLLFLNYIMLLAAIVLMFFANAYSMWFADPYPLEAADIYGVAGYYNIVLIVTFVLFIVGGIAAFCLSKREPITCGCPCGKNRVAAKT